MKPLTAKTVQKTRGRGPGTKGAFPRYVSIGNAKKVASRFDVGVWVPGMQTRRVYLDFDKDGELIGVEVVR